MPKYEISGFTLKRFLIDDNPKALRRNIFAFFFYNSIEAIKVVSRSKRGRASNPPHELLSQR